MNYGIADVFGALCKFYDIIGVFFRQVTQGNDIVTDVRERGTGDLCIGQRAVQAEVFGQRFAVFSDNGIIYDGIGFAVDGGGIISRSYQQSDLVYVNSPGNISDRIIRVVFVGQRALRNGYIVACLHSKVAQRTVQHFAVNDIFDCIYERICGIEVFEFGVEQEFDAGHRTACYGYLTAFYRKLAGHEGYFVIGVFESRFGIDRIFARIYGRGSYRQSSYGCVVINETVDGISQSGVSF